MSNLFRDHPPEPSILDFARRLLDFTPDDVQSTLLTTDARFVLLNCHRQWGKTTLTAVRALHQALSRPRQQIVVVSPTLRQSRVLTNHCREFAQRLGYAFTSDGTNPRSVLFANGSLILPLPAHPDHARGFSAHLLIIDEAARVNDEVYAAVTPLLAATEGHLWLLSTPHGQRGFFYREAIAPPQAAAHPWLRLSAPAEGPQSSGRLTKEFLVAERRRKTAQQFAQEYLCEFTTAESNAFAAEHIHQAFSNELPPFNEIFRESFGHLQQPPHYYLGLDLGQLRDHAALTLLEYRTVPSGTRDPYTWQWLFRRELNLRLVERFPLHTPYRQILDRLARLADHPQIAHHGSLVFDATGAGLPIAELIRERRYPLHILPVSISSGKQAVVTPRGRNVPKADLVSALHHLLERGYLKIAARAPHADLLRQELLQYERRFGRSGGITYAGASATHDDLVMSLALAGWWAWENRKSLLSGPLHKPLAPLIL